MELERRRENGIQISDRNDMIFDDGKTIGRAVFAQIDYYYYYFTPRVRQSTKNKLL